MWVRVAHHVIHLIREPLFLPWRVVPRLIPQQLSPRRSRLRGEELLARAEPLCGSSPLLLAYWPNPTCWNPPPPGCNAGISISERAVTFQGGHLSPAPLSEPGRSALCCIRVDCGKKGSAVFPPSYLRAERQMQLPLTFLPRFGWGFLPCRAIVRS